MRRASFVMVVVALLATPLVSAEEYHGSFGLGAGIVKPENIERAGYYSFDLRFPVGEHIGIGIGSGFWRKAESIPGASASLKAFNGDFGILGQIPLGARGTFEIGGGVSTYLFQGEASFLGQSADESEFKVGGHVLAEGAIRASDSVGFFAQMRYDIVSDANQFKFLGGLRFFWGY